MATKEGKTFFGHPRGLATLFFTEFWERFSYYGMRAILIYYMYTKVVNGGLGFDTATATAIMSIYGSLVYMSGVIGGWFADRVLGSRSTIFWGGVAIMVGHIILSLPLGAAALFISMFFIIIGTGFLKPNVSNVVGDLYAPEDVRRDSGFSIFYMGINLGGFLAPIVVSFVKDSAANFHAGFSVAAIGMAVGLVVYLLTSKRYLGDAGKIPPNPLTTPERRKFGLFALGLVVALAVIMAIFALFQGGFDLRVVINTVTTLGILIPIAYFVVMLRSPKTNKMERSRLLAYIPLFLTSVIFWMIQEQQSSVFAVFAADRTNLNFLGMSLEPSLFQSLNPIFIIALSPVFAWLWTKLGERQPSTPVKFALGVFFAGASFILMMFPSLLHGGDAKTLVSPLWITFSFLICVIGEMCLSPVGLSVTTKLAPAAFSSQTMSLWFLTNAMGQGVNAQITQLYNAKTEVLYFGIIGVVAILIGVIILFLTPLLKRYMQGVR